MKKKYALIHGHFYQPPRENPWLEEIEVQDSAYPFHDWNEKITRECYAPNTTSRALDDDGRIKEIINNFEKISFNVGPTLLSWLKKYETPVYTKILAADVASQLNYGGHGSAIAQAYNHMIMPLASQRDKRTQIIWGIADFVYQFGRPPEGMWLPETAVDKQSLQIMAEHGIKYTILFQGQARAIRQKGERVWSEPTSSIDPSRSYSQPLENGKSIAIFFYDGPISQAIAFEGLLKDGSKFAQRLRSGFSDERDWDQLLNTATDGETFGHHHRFGEMALSFALNHFESSVDVTLTNYGQFLENHPPEMEVDIKENSAWSCAHGVERWKSDCGCSVGAQGWNQKWRGPLRDALDYLKNEIDIVFEAEGAMLLNDPWLTLEEYIEVILNRSTAETFLSRHSARDFSPVERTKAMTLLEAERNGMLMYTSCGWFFDDVSGIETVQILRYAARAMQLLGHVADIDPEPEFIEILRGAKSNIIKQGDAGQIYERQALKEKATLTQIMANQIISESVKIDGSFGLGAAFEVNEENRLFEEYGDTSLAMSLTKIRSRITLEEESMLVATLCLGATDVTCFTKQDDGDDKYTAMFEEIFFLWRKRRFADVVRKLDRYFGPESFTLADLFAEGRQKALHALFANHIAGFSDMYDQLFWRNRKMMDYFVDSKSPAPKEFQLAARFVLEKDLIATASAIDKPGAHEKFAELMSESEKWGVYINPEAIRKEMESVLSDQIGEIIEKRDADICVSVIDAINIGLEYSVGLDYWGMQNRFVKAYTSWLTDNTDSFYGAEQMVALGKLLNFSYE